MCEPGRLWKRYARTNSRFLVLAAAQLLRASAAARLRLARLQQRPRALDSPLPLPRLPWMAVAHVTRQDPRSRRCPYTCHAPDGGQVGRRKLRREAGPSQAGLVWGCRQPQYLQDVDATDQDSSPPAWTTSRRMSTYRGNTRSGANCSTVLDWPRPWRRAARRLRARSGGRPRAPASRGGAKTALTKGSDGQRNPGSA